MSNGSGITRHAKGYWQLTRGRFRNKLLHRAWFERVLDRPLRLDEDVERSCFHRCCLNPGHWILMDERLHHSTTNVNNHYKRRPKERIEMVSPLGCSYADASEFARKYIYDCVTETA